MTDQEALNKIVNYHQKEFENQMGVIAALDYTVLAEDGISAKLTNTEGGSFVGRKIYPDISSTTWRSDIVAEALNKCQQLRKPQRLLSLRFSRQTSYWLIILTYAPLINPDTDNVIGFKITGVLPDFPLNFYNLEKIIQSSHYENKPPLDSASEEQLQEEAILFLLFHCENYQRIAELLSLTNGRKITRFMVSKVVTRKIYPKFAVINLEALKQKAHEQGYHKKIPVGLLGEFMYDLNLL